MSTNRFNYDELPFDEVVKRYRNGASWRELARIYVCPDHKSLKDHVMRRFPDLEVRTRAEAQRARREKEGTKRRRSAAGEASKRPRWWR